MGREKVSRPPLPAPIREGRVVAVLRHLEGERLSAVADALQRAGVRALEVTMNSPEATAGLSRLRRLAAEEVAVGAGTVLDRAGAEAALAAGASFLVMPHTDPELVAWAAGRGVPCLPGAMTATEVLAGWRAGASAVKLFHAATLGPDYLRGLREPLEGIPLVPTGGITADNATAFCRAGAVALGVGGWLLAGGDPELAEQRARALLAALP